MEFRELMDLAKLQAINGVLTPSEMSVWRGMCRTYSKKFRTSLHLVYEMDPEEVMQAIFEDQLDNFDPEKDLKTLHESILRIEDPDFDATEEEDLQDFIKQAEAKEEERLKTGKPVPGSGGVGAVPTLKNTSDKPSELQEKLPVGGKLNLDYFSSNEENER